VWETNLEWQGSVGLVKAMYMKGQGVAIRISQFNNAGNFIWEQLAETALQKC